MFNSEASAILRTDYLDFKAGTLLRSTEKRILGETPTEWIRVYSVGRPWVRLWCKHDNLLPLKFYLKRKPTTNFWALIFKDLMRMKTISPDYFLENTKNLKKVGNRPFRFESLGELKYFANHNNITNYGFCNFNLCND